MNIHPVNHVKGNKNQYCGPSAISILTGMATGEAARLIRHVTGKTAVKGTSTGAVRKALLACGILMMSKPGKLARRKVPNPKWSEGYALEYPTLAQWLKETVSDRSAGRVFLVVARNHWQVITGRRYCCGQTGSIISITDKKCRKRARVTEVYEIVANGKIKIPDAARKPKAGTVINQDAKERATFRADCRRHKMDWTKASDGYIEIDPCDDFPDGLTFLFDGWYDANQMLNRAFRHPEDISEDGYLAH